MSAQAAFEAVERARWRERVRHAHEVNPELPDEVLAERFDCSATAIRRALK